MRHFLIIVLTSFPVFCFSQGLFRYFNWTAYSDGPERIDHIVIDLNWNRVLELPNGVEQKYYNVGFGAYLFHDQPINKKSTLALAIGFGFCSYNLHHNGQFSISNNPDGTSYTDLTPLPGGLDVKRNKLNLNYLEVPIELRIRSMSTSIEEHEAAGIRFYMGFKAGWLVDNHTKYRDSETKVKLYNINNILSYRYGPTLRVGFKKIAFSGFYSLTSIFKTNGGPEIIPFSIGLSWIRL